MSIKNLRKQTDRSKTVVTSLPKYSNELYKFINYKCIYIVYHKRILKISVQFHSLHYLSYTMHIGIQFYCRRKLDYSENLPGVTANLINKVLLTQGYGLLCTSWIFVVLTHWNNNPWVDMSLYSDTLSCFWFIQSVLSLFNAACLADIQQISVPGEGYSTLGERLYT